MPAPSPSPADLGLRPRLDSGPDLHLYSIDLDAHRSSLNDLEPLLSASETTRGNQYVVPRERTYFVLRRALLRCIVGSLLDAPVAEIEFEHLPNGKPRLRGSRLGFNLSSSGPWALIACAWGKEVGADVERVRPVPEARAVARRLYAPDEVAALEPLSGQAFERAFFRIWTRKEAWVKATGRGISDELASWSVLDGPNPTCRSGKAKRTPAGSWRLKDVEVEWPAMAAVCVSYEI